MNYRTYWRIFGILAVAGGIAACAPTTAGPKLVAGEIAEEAKLQRRLFVENRIAQLRRARNLAFVLRTNAVTMCEGKTSHEIGIIVANTHDPTGKYAKIFREVLKLGDNLRIVSVVKESPAAAADLRDGDEIVSVNGKRPSYGQKAFDWFRRVAKESGGKPMKIVFKRDGNEQALSVTGVSACRFPVRIVDSEAINAFADGKSIGLTSGMMRFARTDPELGLVISHELAHNVMGHVEKKQGNATAGAAAGLVFDILAALVGVNTGGAFSKLGGKAASGAYSQGFESEADYVGMYLMARTGLDYRAAPVFWRRMSTINPKTISHATTHPVSPARFLLLKKTIAEIDAKKAAGKALKPNIKPPVDFGKGAEIGSER